MIEIYVNGDPKKVREGTSLTAYVVGLGLDSTKVAVERNREIVPKSQYADTLLSDGDQIEIVHFIGGG